MSQRKGPREAAAGPKSTVLTREQIVQQCYDIYTHPQNNLIEIGAEFGMAITPPKKKLTIMLVGNHSVGKSTFINWYIEDEIQKTSVALETQHLTLITSGKKRESLKGEATLVLFPHLNCLKQLPGVVDSLATEISSSKAKRFDMVTFIDTPGLIEGGKHFNFDISRAVQTLGHFADLIFVLFDPIGQALSSKTLDIVEKLTEKNPEKMRFYLSKADEAGSDMDRQKVLIQIVQEICKRPRLNRKELNLQTIYIPEVSRSEISVNEINSVVKEIENTINVSVQNALNNLEKHCDAIEKVIDQRLVYDAANGQRNGQTFWSVVRSLFFCCCCLLVFFTLSKPKAEVKQSPSWFGSSEVVTESLSLVDVMLNDSERKKLQFILVFLALYFGYKCVKLLNFTPRLDKRTKNRYKAVKTYITEIAKPLKRQLFMQYLQQYVNFLDIDS